MRFAERVKQELVDLVPGHLKDPRLFGLRLLTITSVEVTPDLRHGNVLFSLMGQQKSARQIREIEAALNQASGFLRHELMRRIATKNTPQLVFKYDTGFDSSQEIDPLFRKIAEERATQAKTEEDCPESEGEDNSDDVAGNRADDTEERDR